MVRVPLVRIRMVFQCQKIPLIKEHDLTIGMYYILVYLTLLLHPSQAMEINVI